MHSSETIPTLFGQRRGSLGGIEFSHADVEVDGRLVLHDLTATITPGKLTAFSSSDRAAVDGTFEALTRSIHPVRGSIKVGGVDVRQLSRAEVVRLRRERIGIVGPGHRLASSRTLAENLELPFALAELPIREADRAWLERLIDTFGLRDDLERYPFELCPSRRDRATIARALALRPGLLVLREAFTGDDPHGGAVLMAIIRALVQEHAVTTIICTTNRSAIDACDVEIELGSGNASAQGLAARSAER